MVIWRTRRGARGPMRTRRALRLERHRVLVEFSSTTSISAPEAAAVESFLTEELRSTVLHGKG